MGDDNNIMKIQLVNRFMIQTYKDLLAVTRKLLKNITERQYKAHIKLLNPKQLLMPLIYYSYCNNRICLTQLFGGVI